MFYISPNIGRIVENFLRVLHETKSMTHLSFNVFGRRLTTYSSMMTKYMSKDLNLLVLLETACLSVIMM